MGFTPRIDAEQVKAAAAGRWPVILRALAPELIPALDAGPSRKVTCPLPHHDDRKPSFRIDKPDEGRAICSCGGYDAWNLLELLRRWDFPECLRQVANVLHLDGAAGNGNGKPVVGIDPLVRMAEVKRCPADSLRVFGGTSDPKRKCVTFPMYSLEFPSGDIKRCSTFTVWPDSDNEKFCKGLNAKDRPAGMFLQHDQAGAPIRPKAGDDCLLLEGVKDSGRAHSLGYLAIGLPGKSIKREWLELFRGLNVRLCLDNDQAGKEAAPKVEKALQGVAASVRIVPLPHPGDLRDNLGVEGGEQAVRDAMERAGIHESDNCAAFAKSLSYRAVEPGTIVKAADRQNFGTIVQDLGDRCVVHFESHSGNEADVTLAKKDLTLQDGTPLASKGQSAEPPAFAKLIAFDDFLNMEFPDDEIIPGVIVGGQPGVVGARLKCMKTHMACEAAISMASQTRFCGHFDVARQCRVGLWSGESGRRKVQRILRSQKETHAITGPIPLFVNFSLPKLSLPEHLEVLHEVITDNQLDVCIFDPLYMALLTERTANLAGNVYAMGVVLEPLTQLGQATNCTILTCHHFKKTAAVDQDEPCSLEELSQAGVAEWVGQWILLARRSPYQSDGKHELFMRVGGRAGHASFWALDIDEGDPADGPNGQKWDLALRPISDARAEAKKAAEDRKAQAREQRDNDDRRKMLESIRRCPGGETQKELSRLSGISNERGASAIRSLLGEGLIKRVGIKKHTRVETGYVATDE